MKNTNKVATIMKTEQLEDGSVCIEYSTGMRTIETPVESFFPEYNRYMSHQQFEYLKKKKLNDKLLEKLPPKEKEKIKKL